SQFDSLRVTLQVTDKSIETVLDMAFKKTDFRYAITSQHQIFLTKGHQIRTELAVGFSAGPSSVSAKQPAAVVDDYSEEKEKAVPEATTENKLYEIGVKTNSIKSGNAILTGYIRDI